MREAHPRDRAVGMEYYASDPDGTGGRLRADHDHFRVTEVPDVDLQPADAAARKYPHLIVRVRLIGWDTYGFVHRLAGSLGISRERIRWAGTKDKAAITTQLFSIESIEPAELPDIDGATFKVVGRFGRGLTFGDLLGNRFDLIVSEPTTPAAHESITNSLRDFGGGRVAVPNYFGNQRFGSIRAITHRVGLCILERDWEGAVMTYLADRSEHEPTDTHAAREFIEATRDWEAALDRFPSRLQHERRLLNRLSELDPVAGSQYRHALDAFPRSLRRLFVHAAQSYLFNQIVSERLRRGLSPIEAVPSDVVCFTRETERIGRIPNLDRTQAVTERRTGVINRHLADGRAMLTAPLIGSETEFGQGSPADIEREVLENHDLRPEDFDLPEPFSSRGARRAILVFTDVSVDTDPLRFRFSLPSGSYATVLMREYLKGSPAVRG